MKKVFKNAWLVLSLCFVGNATAGLITYDYVDNNDDIIISLDQKTDDVTHFGMVLHIGDPRDYSSSRIRFWQSGDDLGNYAVDILEGRNLLKYEGQKYAYDKDLRTIGFYISTEERNYYSFDTDNAFHTIDDNGTAFINFNVGDTSLSLSAWNLDFDMFEVDDTSVNVSEPNSLILFMLAFLGICFVGRVGVQGNKL